MAEVKIGYDLLNDIGKIQTHWTTVDYKEPIIKLVRSQDDLVATKPIKFKDPIQVKHTIFGKCEIQHKQGITIFPDDYYSITICEEGYKVST